jgi:hypothetical protein
LSIQKFSEILQSDQKNKIAGCFLDTSVLVAATYDLDRFHDETAPVFNALAALKVPTFSNISIRAEFLEQQRRILFSECLCDFLEDFFSDLEEPLRLKLQSYRTSYRRKADNKQSAKIDVNRINQFCGLLKKFGTDHRNGLQVFSQKYFEERFTQIWSAVVRSFDMNFISSQKDEKNDFLDSAPSWDEATSITGRHCHMGFNDAMILNMFLCSKIPALITADIIMAEVAEEESSRKKQIFIPDSSF